MSRLWTCSIVLALWAAIYLPALGSLEIKGEEGRRILPAISMLETGNWIVPQVGSEPYFRKPPLVNWLVALSIKATGRRDEWAARLPSTLAVLAVALVFVTVACGSLGTAGSLIGALVWLTNLGLLEKGRLIEIEAIYVSLCALALVCWLTCWHEGRSPWLTWIVPSIFLGLGMLAKGPVHLVFFYAVVIAVLVQAGETRQLASLAHAAGVLVLLAIFAAWAIPCLQQMRSSPVAHTWSRQFSGRLTGEAFHLGSWLMNMPRGLAYFLPWTLFLPLLRRAEFEYDRDRALARGLGWGIAISFVAMNLLPGALPRYTMPLLGPAAFLVALLFVNPDAPWPGWALPVWRHTLAAAFAVLALAATAALFRVGTQWWALTSALVVIMVCVRSAVDLWRTPAGRSARIPALVFSTALLVCMVTGLYAVAVIPALSGREKIRTIAHQIDAAIPGRERLYAVDPDYQPFLFYLETPLVYLSEISDVPRDADYLLVQPEKEAEALASQQWQPRHATVVRRLTDYRNRTVVLLAMRD